MVIVGIIITVNGSVSVIAIVMAIVIVIVIIIKLTVNTQCCRGTSSICFIFRRCLE